MEKMRDHLCGTIPFTIQMDLNRNLEKKDGKFLAGVCGSQYNQICIFFLLVQGFPHASHSLLLLPYSMPPKLLGIYFL